VNILDIRDLSVEYLSPRGSVLAVNRVSLGVREGEVLGLAGESGSGKSTTAHAVLRILRPPAVITGGSILFKGRDTLGMDEGELAAFRWKEAAIVFQSAMNALNPVMRIRDQLLDAMLSHGLPRKDALARAEELFDLVGIDPSRLGAYPHQLSGGMRQRAVIAMALSLRPALLVMDEPTTALDVVVQKDILARITSLRKSMGFSVLFITHDLSLLVEFADRIAVMYAGGIVEAAPSRELFSNPLHPYTVGLMDSFPSISGERRYLTGIPGSPPDMACPPPGCAFHERCPRAQAACSSEAPAFAESSPGHSVACHLAEGRTA
jgi:peptide/nickel transport system ATP-binding protein